MKPTILVTAAAALIACNDAAAPNAPRMITALPRALTASERTLVSATDGFAFNLLGAVVAEHPSAAGIREPCADETGAAVEIVAQGPDGVWTEPILNAIDAKTAVVSVPVCHWTDRALIGIEAIARRAREVDAALVIDASQSLGVLPFDVTPTKTTTSARRRSSSDSRVRRCI